MKPIYFKSKTTGDRYKFIMEESIPQDQIDSCLDVFGNKDNEFIADNEFESSRDSFLEFDVLDTTESYKIGTLITKNSKDKHIIDFESYLIDIGVKSIDFMDIELDRYIGYFKICNESGISTYKSLFLLRNFINNNNEL